MCAIRRRPHFTLEPRQVATTSNDCDRRDERLRFLFSSFNEVCQLSIFRVLSEDERFYTNNKKQPNGTARENIGEKAKVKDTLLTRVFY